MRTNIHYSARPRIAGDVGVRDSIATGTARFSAGLVFFFGTGGVDLGSAIAVKVGHRHFLATAGHNLDGIPSDRDIHIVPAQTSRAEWLPFVARNATRDRGPGAADVGWIELEADTARASGLRFLETDAISRGSRWRSRYLIHGLPAGLATHGLHARGRIIHLTSLALMTRSVTRAPENDLAAPDLKLRYESRLPPAHGLSGGGVWEIPRQGSTGSPRLAGIVRHWDRRAGTLAGAPIQRWLELVREDFSDLREVVDRLLAGRMGGWRRIDDFRAG